MISENKISINLVVLFFLSAFWLFFCYANGTISSGYHFMDDHIIVVMCEMLGKDDIYSVCKYFINVYEPITRFRPVYWIIKILECNIFGMNIHIHFIYLALLGGITSFLFFLFGKNIGFSIFQSIIFAFIILLGEQSEIWWMSGAAENRGVFFLALALYIFSISYKNGRDSIFRKIIFCTCVIISALCKESFILFIPAILFLRIFLPIIVQKKSITTHLLSNIVIGLILLMMMFAELIYINTKGTNFGYAGVDQSTPLYIYIQTFESLYIRNFSAFIFIISIIISVITVLFLEKIKKKIGAEEAMIDWYLFLTIFNILCIIPQIFLYSKSGLIGRYLVPISIGPAMFLVAPLGFINRFIEDIDNKFKYILCFLMLIPSFIIIKTGFRSAKNSASSFTGRGYENEILNSISKQTKNNNKPILIVIDPTLIPTLENQYALKVYIKKYLRKQNPIYFDLLSSSDTTKLTGFPLEIYRAILQQSKNQTIEFIQDKNQIETILIFYGLNDYFLESSKTWFDKKNYKTEPHNSFTIFHK